MDTALTAEAVDETGEPGGRGVEWEIALYCSSASRSFAARDRCRQGKCLEAPSTPPASEQSREPQVCRLLGDQL
jgi:hypothetical protein